MKIVKKKLKDKIDTHDEMLFFRVEKYIKDFYFKLLKIYMEIFILKSLFKSFESNYNLIQSCLKITY